MIAAVQNNGCRIMKTCRVTGFVLAPNGQPLPSAVVEFRMNRIDKEDVTLILSETVLTVLGSDGSLDVDIWPNSRGYAGTFYTVTIQVPRENMIARHGNFRVVVPDLPTAILNDIAELLPPPPINEGRQQVILAREARDEARAALADVVEIAEAVNTNAQLAVNSAGAASASAGTALDASADAGRSAAASEASAGEADTAKRAAEAAQGNAETTAFNAGKSAEASERSAAASLTSKDAAVAAASNADARATAAKTSETNAETAAGEAATAATKATNATLTVGSMKAYNAAGIEAGGYDVIPRVSKPSKQVGIFAKITNGASGCEVILTLRVNKVAVHGPVSVTLAAPLTITGLSIPLAVGDEVDFVIVPTPGAVRYFYAETFGAIT